MRTEKIRDTLLKFVPFVCASFVVGLHSYNVSESSWSLASRIEGFFSHGICMAAVPTFFAVSGYLFFRNVDGIQSVFEKQKRRIVSLLLPFLSWSAAYYFLYAIGGRYIQIATTVDTSFVGVVKGILLYQYVFPMWYMFALAEYTLIAPITYFFLKQGKIVQGALLIALIAAGFFQLSLSIDAGGLERTIFAPNFYFYYYLGALLTKAEYRQRILNGIGRIKAAYVLALFPVVCFVNSLLYDGLVPVCCKRMLVPIIFGCFVFLMYKAAVRIRQGAYRLRVVDRIPTMILYGIHPLVGIVLGRLIPRSLPALAIYFASMSLNVVISSMIAIGIKKIRILNFIFNGNR